MTIDHALRRVLPQRVFVTSFALFSMSVIALLLLFFTILKEISLSILFAFVLWLGPCIPSSGGSLIDTSPSVSNCVSGISYTIGFIVAGLVLTTIVSYVFWIIVGGIQQLFRKARRS